MQLISRVEDLRKESQPRYNGNSQTTKQFAVGVTDARLTCRAWTLVTTDMVYAVVVYWYRVKWVKKNE